MIEISVGRSAIHAHTHAPEHIVELWGSSRNALDGIRGGMKPVAVQLAENNFITQYLNTMRSTRGDTVQHFNNSFGRDADHRQ